MVCKGTVNMKGKRKACLQILIFIGQDGCLKNFGIINAPFPEMIVSIKKEGIVSKINCRQPFHIC